MTEMAGVAWMMASGIFLQAFGQYQMGQAAKDAGEIASGKAELERALAEEYAGQALAVSQRDAAEARRQTELIASRSLAVAAASGGGVSDPTVVNLIANAAGEGEYRARVALYEGEARARSLRQQAILGTLGAAQAEAVLSGRTAQMNLSALGTLMRGTGSLYAKYGVPSKEPGDAGLIRETSWVPIDIT